jgi:hypothetical protein
MVLARLTASVHPLRQTGILRIERLGPSDVLPACPTRLTRRRPALTAQPQLKLSEARQDPSHQSTCGLDVSMPPGECSVLGRTGPPALAAHRAHHTHQDADHPGELPQIIDRFAQSQGTVLVASQGTVLVATAEGSQR